MAERLASPGPCLALPLSNGRSIRKFKNDGGNPSATDETLVSKLNAGQATP
jgi:hypothetical protein